MRVVAERAGRALGLPHRRRLRRVTRHRVAGAGAVLRGHLPVFHNLLYLGSFVLKPDFHLGGGTKAYVTGTLRGRPRLPQAGDGRHLRPPGGPALASSRCPRSAAKGLRQRQSPARRPQRAPWTAQRPAAAARARPSASVFCLGWRRGARVSAAACAQVQARARRREGSAARVSATTAGVRARDCGGKGAIYFPPDSLQSLLGSGRSECACSSGRRLAHFFSLYRLQRGSGGSEGKGKIQGRFPHTTAPPARDPPAAAA